MIGSLPSGLQSADLHRALPLYADAGRYVHRHRLQTELTLTLHFHTVEPTFCLPKLSGSSGSRETTHVCRDRNRHHRRLNETVAEYRQVDLVAIDGVLRPGWIGAALGAMGKLSQRRINSSICFLTGCLAAGRGKSRGSARNRWYSRHAGIGKAANIVKPQSRCTMPIRPVALAAAARSGSAFTSC